MLLEIKNLHFSHNPNQKLFQNFNLKIDEGKIVAVAGESGCGKSTLLNLIYGLLQWEKGEIILDDETLYGPKKNIVPGESEIKMVAQTYDLMPYATVAENVGKFLSNINLAQKKDKINQLLEVVGMEHFATIL
ncbi:MAG: ATP-binding cassette domain-containing protein, partial [Chryseobacterium sp.]|nr:ATP-binding cassette domain-containing protein [Chryseobacterium sp.]